MWYQSSYWVREFALDDSNTRHSNKSDDNFKNTQVKQKKKFFCNEKVVVDTNKLLLHNENRKICIEQSQETEEIKV